MNDFAYDVHRVVQCTLERPVVNGADAVEQFDWKETCTDQVCPSASMKSSYHRF